MKYSVTRVIQANARTRSISKPPLTENFET